MTNTELKTDVYFIYYVCKFKKGYCAGNLFFRQFRNFIIN